MTSGFPLNNPRLLTESTTSGPGNQFQPCRIHIPEERVTTEVIYSVR